MTKLAKIFDYPTIVADFFAKLPLASRLTKIAIKLVPNDTGRNVSVTVYPDRGEDSLMGGRRR
jgi:hypothetical protein